MNQQLEPEIYTPWLLLRAYWRSEYRKSAYAFLASVLIISMMLVGMDVVFTNWYNYFYNALQDYDWRGAFDLILIFLFLAGMNLIFAVYRYYLQSFLALRWRRWLTHQFLNRWLAKRSYYYLEDFNDTTDNPDQRIQEDINSLVNTSLSLLVGMLSAVVTIFAFIFILWELSGLIRIPLGPLGVLAIPGYLVWVAIIYAIIGTTVTFKIGRPLVMLNFEQQRREANFRFAAIDLRSHAEHVALYRGEEHQKTILYKIFGGVLDNWYAIILRQKLLLWFTAGYNQLSVILPLIVALPNYFNKVFKLGGLIQTLSAFGRIQEALSFIVNSYTTIAEWQAVMRRLLTFLNRMHEVEQEAAKSNHFNYAETSQNIISTRALNIFTPSGEKLLENITEDFVHGKDYWVKGSSGIGKSTFVRVLAGIWPFGSGAISLPRAQNIMYIPQRSYMPLGTLQEALLFPDNVLPVSEEELKKLLRDCDLPNLANELHHATIWSEHLSPGELQRIAFVRVLLHKPDWVFLDESTSALDLSHEQQLYRLLKERLPNCSVVSIGHRPSLDEYHDHQVDLSAYTHRTSKCEC
ncbi:MAG TPA: ABC transporter ATP-binding protein/permease [Gammaproteobacteria bacterium]|nr:ABC transporter ATP-binding protein/permease [Gammaproteobacteria bacterium]